QPRSPRSRGSAPSASPSSPIQPVRLARPARHAYRRPSRCLEFVEYLRPGPEAVGRRQGAAGHGGLDRHLAELGAADPVGYRRAPVHADPVRLPERDEHRNREHAADVARELVVAAPDLGEAVLANELLKRPREVRRTVELCLAVLRPEHLFLDLVASVDECVCHPALSSRLRWALQGNGDRLLLGARLEGDESSRSRSIAAFTSYPPARRLPSARAPRSAPIPRLDGDGRR